MMNDRIVSPHRLRALYSFLTIVATVAATKAMVWPSGPEARPLDQEAITKAITASGFNASPLKPLAAKSNSELATSDAIGYSIGNGLELRLMRGAVRRRFNLQAAYLATSHPDKLLLSRRHFSHGTPSYAMGLIQTQPANQTCLVEGGGMKDAFAVTRNDLSRLIDQASKSKWSSIRSIVGLQANRSYQCILIQVTTTDKATSSIDQPTWLRTLSVLQSAQQSKSSQS
jgi:hypothetical protein